MRRFCGLLRAPVGRHRACVHKRGKWEMTAFCPVFVSCLLAAGQEF